MTGRYFLTENNTPVDQPTIEIRPATDTDLPALRALLEDYVAWLDVDLTFQDFQSEYRTLPGDYAPPRGRLLAASVSGRVRAMIALRPIDEATCEMKRLYVSPDARGLGLGRALVLRVVNEARAIGYRVIRLDTLPQMGDAQSLYSRLGFRDIEPYYDSPISGTRFMEMTL